jgi:hypothetical protein
LLAIQRVRESRARKAAIAAARAATRAKTMKKKADAKATGVPSASTKKSSSTAASLPSSGGAAAASSSSSSSVPPLSPSYRIVDLHKLAAVLNKFVDPGREPLEDMNDRAFQQRHRQLERDEKQIRKEEM